MKHHTILNNHLCSTPRTPSHFHPPYVGWWCSPLHMKLHPHLQPWAPSSTSPSTLEFSGPPPFSLSKVDNPYLVIFILLGHLYLSSMWFGATPRLGIKMTCFKEIGLCVQNTIIILGSIVNLIRGGPIRSCNIHEIFTLIMNKIFIWAPRIMRKVAMALIWFANHLVLICVFHILG